MIGPVMSVAAHESALAERTKTLMREREGAKKAMGDVLDVLNDLFGYEGDDPIEGIRAIAKYVRCLEQQQANIIDPMASLDRLRNNRGHRA